MITTNTTSTHQQAEKYGFSVRCRSEKSISTLYVQRRRRRKCSADELFICLSPLIGFYLLYRWFCLSLASKHTHTLSSFSRFLSRTLARTHVAVELPKTHSLWITCQDYFSLVVCVFLFSRSLLALIETTIFFFVFEIVLLAYAFCSILCCCCCVLCFSFIWSCEISDRLQHCQLCV